MQARGQVSAEFAVILTVLFIVLLAFLAIYSSQNNNLQQARQTLEAKRIAAKIAGTINEVLVSGSGARAKIAVDVNDEYNITLSTNNVQVEINKVKVQAPAITNRFNTTRIATGTIAVSNNNGVVEIG